MLAKLLNVWNRFHLARVCSPASNTSSDSSSMKEGAPNPTKKTGNQILGPSTYIKEEQAPQKNRIQKCKREREKRERYCLGRLG